MKHKLLNQSGLSIVATVMIMMILALFAAAAVSLITTAAGTGIQEERGTEAFYIADGGMRYTLKKNTYPYYDIYDATPTPLTDRPLGNGSFTLTVPTLTSNAAVGDTSLSVSSTDGFTSAPDNSYWTLICAVDAGNPRLAISMSTDCEKISCTSKFSSCTRGKDSTDAAAHPGSLLTPSSASVVMMYSWDTAKTTTITTRTFGKGDKCTNASSTICVLSTDPFADSGFVRISYSNPSDENKIEDVFYDGKGNTCGTGCSACLGTNYASGAACKRRAFDGDAKGTVNHISGTTIYQSEFSVLAKSTGEVPGAIILSNIKRVLQTNVLPLKDP